MEFSLSTIRRGDGAAVPVLEVEGRYYLLDSVAPELTRAAPARGLMNLFGDWEASFKRLSEIAADIGAAAQGQLVPAPEPGAFMAPLQFPPKLILGGANYYEHMFKDAKKPDFRKEEGTPVFFLKPPSTSLVGCGKTVRYPTQTNQLDWEIELAVIIGRTMRRVDEAEALAGVAGYCVGIDLSARDWQFNPRHPWKFDLFTGKSFDDSCPVGPKLVPSAFVDPKALQLRLWVNDELKQDASSSDMIWSVAEQVSILSEHVTLEPGDILLTGTPAGVGQAMGTYLKVGDVVRAEIEKLGTLEVEIVPGSESPRTPRAG